MKKAWCALLLALPLSAQAGPDEAAQAAELERLASQLARSDAARIAELEYKVARLTEQVNLLLAERSSATASGEVHICRLKAFTRSYEAENGSRGRAKWDVLKQCRRDNHQMHCRESEITCDSYR